MPRRVDLRSLTRSIGNISSRLRKIESSITLTPVRYTVAHSTFLQEDTFAGALTIEIGSFPAWADPNELWVLIGAGGIDCEIRKISSINGPILTFAPALIYDHNETDSVVYVNEPIFNVKYWGAKGDDNINAIWVVGGYCDTNTLAYSNDGINWIGLGNAIFSVRCTGVAYNGSMWVATGQGINTLAYSSDGINWTGIGVAIFSTRGYGISWNGTMWVALGQGTNTIAYSYDGINWTGIGTAIFSTFGYRSWWSGSMWVAGGSGTNTIAYSYDGINWTGIGTAIFDVWGGRPCWNEDDDMWVMVGNGSVNTIAYSYDGINWTGEGDAIFTEFAHDVKWNGSMWVAMGYGVNRIAWSNNGLNWNGLGDSVFVGGGEFVGGEAVSWNGYMWVAAGEGIANTMAYSYNGVNWTGSGKVFDVYGIDVCWEAGASDDTTPIQRAINQIQYLTYGVAYIPAGTYLLNGTLNISFNNLRIFGDGMYQTILHFIQTATAHCFYGIGTSGASLKANLQIDNLQIYSNSGAGHSIYLKWFSQILIDKVYIYKSGQHGILLEACDRTDLLNCKIIKVDEWGIVCVSDGGGFYTKNLRISNNSIFEPGQAGASRGGIYLDSVSSFQIIGNIVKDMPNYGWAHFIYNSSEFNIADNAAIDNAAARSFALDTCRQGSFAGNLSTGNYYALWESGCEEIMFGANYWSEYAQLSLNTADPRVKFFDREHTTITALQCSLVNGSPVQVNLGPSGAAPLVWQFPDQASPGIGVWVSPPCTLFGANHSLRILVNWAGGTPAGGNFNTRMYVDPIAVGGLVTAALTNFSNALFAHPGIDINTAQIYGPFIFDGMSLLRIVIFRYGGADPYDTATSPLHFLSMTIYWD